MTQVSNTVQVIVTAAAAAVPAYIASMTARQVKAMTAANNCAPTNGSSSIQSVTPTEWQTSDPGNTDLPGIISAWSGGFKALTGYKLYVNGGGHSDSMNNGIYVFDFSGTNQPVGWTVRSQSTVANVVIGAPGKNADNRPSSAHTYDGWVAHNNGKLYRFGGATSDPTNGGPRTDCWEYDPTVTDNSAAWTGAPTFPNYPTGGVYAATVYDPTSGNIFVAPAINGGTGWDTGFFFRTATRTWSGAKTIPLAAHLGTNPACAFDTSVRSRAIIRTNTATASGNSQFLYTLNFSTETVTCAVQTLPAQITAGMCMFYEPAPADCYWAFGNNDWTHLYQINASTLALTTTHTLNVGPDTVVSPGTESGSYGRYVFMPTARAIGVVASVTSPAYVIKLP